MFRAKDLASVGLGQVPFENFDAEREEGVNSPETNNWFPSADGTSHRVDDCVCECCGGEERKEQQSVEHGEPRLTSHSHHHSHPLPHPQILN